MSNTPIYYVSPNGQFYISSDGKYYIFREAIQSSIYGRILVPYINNKKYKCVLQTATGTKYFSPVIGLNFAMPIAGSAVVNRIIAG